MNADDLRTLAEMSHVLRGAGADTVADGLDDEISTVLDGQAIEDDFDRLVAAEVAERRQGRARHREARRS